MEEETCKNCQRFRVINVNSQEFEHHLVSFHTHIYTDPLSMKSLRRIIQPNESSNRSGFARSLEKKKGARALLTKGFRSRVIIHNFLDDVATVSFSDFFPDREREQGNYQKSLAAEWAWIFEFNHLVQESDL